jgi:hypothetical protein
VRPRPTLRSRAGRLAAATVAFLLLLTGTALAQAGPDYTPETSITPTKIVQPWIYQMAIGAVILGLLIVFAFAFSYLRYSPKFFGREEPPKPLPPGARPQLLTRQAAVRAPTPQPAAVGASAPPPSASRPAAGTATAVAERPPAPAEPEITPPQEATEPSGPHEPAQAAPAQAAPPPPQTAPAPGQAVPHGGPAALDQETFDRVLAEQLEKGVDRRVAEGRARAAAVVAARKKAQG